ncbi:hypothetical protein A1O7_01846 [Cladophialophora yegresii CBS 114405]|uniref:CFEM domain-containing protein n=1 Tax=Cladophialophora yegresii CBS 114405 TaxID=1182544 RepID=W9WKI4_9EURO|nr:uncharacterized protein A1O7_01846 [Cladophialophora yegresii CBS 114405]EXJ65505.1 hypothetical protein A1O7_01846 [Cladophialophora yegresii CBS 114405]
MVSTLSVVKTVVLLLLYVRCSVASYEKWEDLPSCAQDCLTQTVNASLAGCNELSIGCFCDNGFATAAFEVCLASDGPCDSDPVNTDSEDFESNVLCNANTDSGFRFTAVKGTETVILGLGANKGEGMTMANTDQGQTTAPSSAPSSSLSSSSPTTVSASVTSPAYTSAPVATRITPGILTSVSTVVVELSSVEATSTATTGTSIESAVTTVVVVAAASAKLTSMLIFVSGFLMTWVPAIIAETFGWP